MNTVLPQASGEQKLIVEKAVAGFNVKVDAVAGSGKTTTILHIAKALALKRILLITYNRRLKEETREKAIATGAVNLEVHSFHAFCVKYYNTKASRDQGIVETLFKNMLPRRLICFDLIIIDEAQDMKPLYFNLMIHLLKHNKPELKPALTESDSLESDSLESDFSESDKSETEEFPSFSSSDSDSDSDSNRNSSADSYTDQVDNNTQICVFGDVRQNIYAFQSSDQRYLSMADVIFPTLIASNREWIQLNLKTSFRVNKSMANFINKVCLQEDRMAAVKHGSKPKYLICDPFKQAVFNEVKALLSSYSPAEIFIIGPSIRNKNSPIGKLENKLVQAGYPCYVPISDDAKLNESDCVGKIVFSTIHQVKGLERKVVLLFNFDETYFKFYNKAAVPTDCPNEIYVAITRAQEKLILIHNSKYKCMPFLQADLLETYTNRCVLGKFNPKKTKPLPNSNNKSVSECIRHVKIETITKIQEFLKYKSVVLLPKQNQSINIPTTIDGTFGTENVADINGTCLPAIYELFQTGHCTIFQHVYENQAKLPTAHRARFRDIWKRYQKSVKKSLKSADFLYIANLYQSLQSGYQFKLEQIANYNWIQSTEIAKALKLMKKYVSTAAVYEKQVMNSIKSVGLNRNINGFIDIVDFESPLTTNSMSSQQTTNAVMHVWEIKCVQQIDTAHVLQLAFYAWMLENNPNYEQYKKFQKKYYVLNILTEEIIELLPETDLVKVVQILLDEKFKSNKKISDAEFIAGISHFGL